jgi:hypothetical protein
VLTSGLTQDPRWHAERFAFQPVDAVLKAYRWATKERAKRINDLSLSTARLAAMVEIAAFPGLGNKARTEDQFLPFLIKDAPGKSARITPETAATIRWLIKNGQMPPRVLALAMEELQRTGI